MRSARRGPFMLCFTISLAASVAFIYTPKMGTFMKGCKTRRKKRMFGVLTAGRSRQWTLL
jgi:hypothetical protein